MTKRYSSGEYKMRSIQSYSRGCAALYCSSVMVVSARINCMISSSPASESPSTSCAQGASFARASWRCHKPSCRASNFSSWEKIDAAISVEYIPRAALLILPFASRPPHTVGQGPPVGLQTVLSQAGTHEVPPVAQRLALSRQRSAPSKAHVSPTVSPEARSTSRASLG